MPKAGHNNLLKVAQILKSNGAKGELVLGFRDFSPEDINIEEPIFIYFDGLLVPYFIDSFVKRGNKKALVYITDVENEEDTEELIGKEVFIEDDNASERADEIESLIGWTLFSGELNSNDEIDELNEIGKITDYIEIPNNPCIEITKNNGAVLIPLHEDLILSVDPENQELIMSLPEGLLDS